MSTEQDVWARQAAQWARVGPPLRPCTEDTDRVLAVARDLARGGRPLDVLLLGVTPELAVLPWPNGTTLLAVDRSAAMIGGVWPGHPGPGQGALQGDWRTVDLPAASRDLVVGDGVFSVLPFPRDAARLLDVVRAVLRPTGRFVVRTFVRPQVVDTVDQVLADALAGQPTSFHAFKLRLLMAVQGDDDRGVRLGDVLDTWRQVAPDVDRLHAVTGWSGDTIATLEAYRDQEAVLVFPRRQDLVEVASTRGFDTVRQEDASYTLGDRCPTLVLAPRSRSL